MNRKYINVLSKGLLATVIAAAMIVPTTFVGQPKTASAAVLSAQQEKYAQIQAAYAAKVVTLVNKEREKAGLKPLSVHTKLTTMAKDKAIEMYNKKYFSHTSPKYGSPFDMMDTYKISYRYAGENIAKGQRSADEAMTAWMNSPGHKANILNANYTQIGVGYYNGHWVQEFIGTK